MAKHRTRKEKILADTRHTTYHFEAPELETNSPEKIKMVLPEMALPQPKTQALSSHGYVFADIRKTALITGIIIAAEIILFFITRV